MEANVSVGFKRGKSAVEKNIKLLKDKGIIKRVCYRDAMKISLKGGL